MLTVIGGILLVFLGIATIQLKRSVRRDPLRTFRTRNGESRTAAESLQRMPRIMTVACAVLALGVVLIVSNS